MNVFIILSTMFIIVMLILHHEITMAQYKKLITRISVKEDAEMMATYHLRQAFSKFIVDLENITNKNKV